MIKAVSIGAFYDADTDVSDWKIQPDFVAEKVEDIIEIIERLE